MDTEKIFLPLIFLILFLFSSPFVYAAEPKNSPVKITKIGDSGLSSLTLTPKAVERLGIKTIKVTGGNATSSQFASTNQNMTSGNASTVIPYTALIYDENGKTWVYITKEPMVYLRHPIVVDHIQGNSVFLTEGPPIGTEIVTIGVDELYGAETGIGK